MAHSVVLTNPQGLRLQLRVPTQLHQQPVEAAEQEANHHPEHAKLGPWVAGDITRCL